MGGAEPQRASQAGYGNALTGRDHDASTGTEFGLIKIASCRANISVRGGF